MIYYIVIYCICSIYMVLDFKYDLQMFQQNSYRLPRFWRWLQKDMASTWRLVDVACLFLVFSTLLTYQLTALLVAVVAIVKIVLILRRKSIKPLVFTSRVWRLYSLTALLSLGGVAATAACCMGQTYWGYYPGYNMPLGLLLLLTIFSWAPVMLADIILMPVEKMIRGHYISDAKKILRSMPDLTIIGVTGSYGKTSTKHYLAQILSEDFDTLITPGSFNTPMGVVRTIRENLRPYNQIFICEMGAKQVGDIKEICDIVHPSMGIITAVGPMHLETFKTIDRVCSTKFELADALPADGLAVINNDSEPCAAREVTNVKALRYGVKSSDGCDFWAEDVKYSSAGTTFTVVSKTGLRFELATRLLGEPNISDILGGVVIALSLGMKPEAIRRGVASIQQVEHRLSISRTPGGVTIIDDAFNSNPTGARMAVEVLAQFNDGNRILVTPGMVELGARQEELNEQFGEFIGTGNKVDIVYVVGRTNRDAIVRGLRRGDIDKDKIVVVDSFREAQSMLAPKLRKDDTVLYENDLPDSFK